MKPQVPHEPLYSMFLMMNYLPHLTDELKLVLQCPIRNDPPLSNFVWFLQAFFYFLHSESILHKYTVRWAAV
jgi:hypothetical protein